MDRVSPKSKITYSNLFWSVVVILEILSSQVYGAELLCQKIDSLRSSIVLNTNLETVTGRAQQQVATWDFIKKTSELLFDEYLNGSVNADSLDQCLTDTNDKQMIDEALPSVFFEKSLDLLAQSHGVIIQKFVKSVQQRYEATHTSAFRLLGHLKEDENLVGTKGGFHRGAKSIFMDFTKIPPNEWLLIFSHELIHSLDPFLAQAVQDYGDLEIGKLAVHWNSITNDPKQLKKEDLQRLDKWLKAGLDRGLVAEYRAWALTFIIYQEGLKENLWLPISWLDSILALKIPIENISQFTYRYLNLRFVESNDSNDSSDDIFNLPLIKNEIDEIRNNYRQTPPPVGILSNN